MNLTNHLGRKLTIYFADGYQKNQPIHVLSHQQRIHQLKCWWCIKQNQIELRLIADLLHDLGATFGSEQANWIRHRWPRWQHRKVRAYPLVQLIEGRGVCGKEFTPATCAIDTQATVQAGPPQVSIHKQHLHTHLLQGLSQQ